HSPEAYDQAIMRRSRTSLSQCERRSLVDVQAVSLALEARGATRRVNFVQESERVEADRLEYERYATVAQARRTLFGRGTVPFFLLIVEFGR
ncbi:MAG TPA: hypothetical protein VGR71_05550, partial [Nitrospira sp.]|nr:hypothetical protein [Nitrospira sp.]